MTQPRFRTPHVLLGALALLFSVTLTAQDAASRFAVAVVRADGAIVPFAAYHDGRWREMWTAVERKRYEIPATLDDIDRDWWRGFGPILAWWYAPPGGETTSLAVTGVRLLATPCSGDVGLLTDLQPAADPPPERTAPYPKLGLATSARVSTTPIVPALPGSEEWRTAREVLSRSFYDLETRQLLAMRWGHPIPPRERRDTPVQLNTALHVPGSRFIYVEATRRYRDPNPPDDQPPCPLVTFVQGFLWRNDRGRLEPVSMTSLVSYCHMEDAMYAWPLGAIDAGGHRYWLTQLAGWTAEGYGVLELDEQDGRVRERVWHVAGRCGRAR